MKSNMLKCRCGRTHLILNDKIIDTVELSRSFFPFCVRCGDARVYEGGLMNLAAFIKQAFTSKFELIEVNPTDFFISMYYVRKYASILQKRDTKFSSYSLTDYSTVEYMLGRISSPYDLTFYIRKLASNLYNQLTADERNEVYQDEELFRALTNAGLLVLITDAFCGAVFKTHKIAATCCDIHFWRLNLYSMPSYDLYFETEEALNMCVYDFNLDSYKVFSRNDSEKGWILNYEI